MRIAAAPAAPEILGLFETGRGIFHLRPDVYQSQSHQSSRIALELSFRGHAFSAQLRKLVDTVFAKVAPFNAHSLTFSEHSRQMRIMFLRGDGAV